FYRVGLAGTASEKGNMGRVGQLLGGCPGDRYHWEWHYLKRVSHADLLTLPRHKGPIRCTAFRPAGKRLVSRSQDQTVLVWDATRGGELLECKGHCGEIQSVACSPDGKWLASASEDRTVRIWNGTTGQEEHVFRKHTSGVFSVAFHPDSTRLASTSQDGTV